MSSSVKAVAAAVGLLAVTPLAWGADLAPPAAPAPYSWTGLYIGLNAGYASAKVTNTVSGGGLDGSGSVNMPGGIGGAQIGYNYQIGPMVLGFEADSTAPWRRNRRRPLRPRLERRRAPIKSP